MNRNIRRNIILVAVLLLTFVLGVGGSAYAASPTFTDPNEAGAYIRELLVKPENDKTTLYYVTTNPDKEDVYFEVLSYVPNTTRKGSDGDYLLCNQTVNRSCKLMEDYGDGTYKYYLTFSTRKRNTAAEEAQVDAKVKQIEAELALDSKSDYEKIHAIYQYLVEHISYGELEGENGHAHSGYGALVQGKCVCEGYAQAFYRLAIDSGLHCRIVVGLGEKKGHAWCIVELDGLYYYIDPTSGDSQGYSAFLFGTDQSGTYDYFYHAGYPEALYDMAEDSYLKTDAFFQNCSPEKVEVCVDDLLKIDPSEGHIRWEDLYMLGGEPDESYIYQNAKFLDYSKAGTYRVISQELIGENFKLVPVEIKVKNHTWHEIVDKATFKDSGRAFVCCKICGFDKNDYVIPKLKSVTIASSKTYTGSPVKPAVTVKDVNGKVMKAGTDYTVTYSNNKAVGKAKAVIDGKTHYNFHQVKYFKILPKKASVKTLTAGKKKLTVKMGSKVASTGGSTYEIQYRVKGSSKWKTVTTTSSSKTLKSLKKGKKYQVKVRAYKAVDGTKYYGAWSAVKTSDKIK